MPDAFQDKIQHLNEKHFGASAWILWKPGPSGTFQIIDKLGFASHDLQSLVKTWDGHEELLQQVQSTRTIQRASANSEQLQQATSKALNLIAIPIVSQDKVTAVLELFFQETEQANSAIHNEALHDVVDRIAKLMESNPHSQSNQQTQLAEYLIELVSKTREQELLHAIANAICSKCAIDRCSFYSQVQNKTQLLVVSGHREIESRSETILSMQNLVDTHAKSISKQNPSVTITGEALVKVRSQTAVIIPLGNIFHGSESPQQTAGVMLLEFFDKPHDSDSSNLLIDNLQKSLPLWKLVIQSSRSKTPIARQSTRRNFLILTSLIAAVCLLVFLPVDLTIRVPGQVVPASRHHLFAPENGLIKIEDLHLPADGAPVISGQHLLTITNQELLLKSSQLEGQIASATDEIRSLKNKRPDRETLSTHPSIDKDLSIRLAEVQTRLNGLKQEQTFLQKRIHSLQLHSPHQGTILSWDVENQLAGRPVSRGQLLLSVGNTNGNWEVLADVSQPDIGPLKKIAQPINKPIPIIIILDSSPDRHWKGKLSEISPIVRQLNPGEYVLPVKGKITDQIKDVLPGSRVTIRVSCGSYPLGYVLFRGIIDSICNKIAW